MASMGGLRRLAQRASDRAARHVVGRLVAGQPVHETHPHLLGQDELLPGLSRDEFAQRRRALAQAMPRNSIAVLPGAPPQFVTGIIPHAYRQDADLLYLTGITQPAVAILGDAEEHDGLFHVVVPPINPDRVRWEGIRITPEAAMDVFQADDAYEATELPERLCGLLSNAATVLYDADRGHYLLQQAEPLQAAMTAGNVRPLRPMLHHLRWVKSRGELALLRGTIEAACDALQDVMQGSCRGGDGYRMEHDIAARFDYLCKRRGASRVSFPPVVASGADACTIHYGRNDKVLQNGALLLMDAGCERFGFASDVTRTWPLGGRFTGPQRAVYEAVSEVHHKCLAAIQPGVTMRHVHALSVRLLSEALLQLGILRHASMSDMAAGAYRQFYPHSIGHWIGMDVHDVSSVSHERPLVPGVALTVEPGLYIPDLPEYGHFAGIGVRIEDDVVVTEAGCEVLSGGLPVAAEEVEALCGR